MTRSWDPRRDTTSVLIGDVILVLPNGTSLRRNALVLHPLIRMSVHDPDLRPHATNPDATHLEFARVRRVVARYSDEQLEFPLYVYLRALKQVGPPIDQQWERVPLARPGGVP